MDGIFGADFSAELGRLEGALGDALAEFLEPWVLFQLLLVLAAFLISIALGGRIERAFEPRVRAVQGQPRLLRLLALLLRRTRWLLAAALLGIALVGLRSVTGPGNSAIVGAAALLTGSWVAISVVSRLIRNRMVARLLAWAAWIIVALLITDTYDEVAATLDRLALRLGAISISLYDVIEAVVVIAVVLWLAATAGRFLERRLAANEDLTPSLRVLAGKLVRIALVVFAGAVALGALGIDLTALTLFSGAVGVGLGFGLQKVVSNFVSGIIILLDKSIKPGDTIELGQTFGWVRSLRSRFVSVMTRDGTEYLVPNEDFITQRVISWSHTHLLHRLDVHFGTTYESDPHHVRQIAIEAAKSVERVKERPQPVCHITAFKELSVDYILRFWIDDPQNGTTNVRGAVMLAIWDAFKAAGIRFPYPRHDVILRSPVEIKVGAQAGGADRHNPSS